MKIDRLRCFLGKPILFTDEIELYSPTIEEIVEIGEYKYLLYLHISCFDSEFILKDLFKIENDLYNLLRKLGDYEALIYFNELTELISEGLSFFTKRKVEYVRYNKSFYCNGKLFVNKDNYKDVAEIIRKLNCIETDEDEINNINFVNDRVKKKYEKMLREKRRLKKNKSNKENQIELKDLLSILCNTEGNGINIFNVHKLTIYQVYEHLERFNIKEDYKKKLLLWGNTYSLKEGSKLPELLVRTKY